MIQELPPDLRPRWRVLQVITAALVMGVMIFGAVVAAMPPMTGGAGSGGGGGAGAPGLDIQMLRLICLGLAGSGLVGGLVIRQSMSRLPAPTSGMTMQVSSPEHWAFQRFFVATIVGLALLEGPALFGVVIHLLGREPIDLAIAGGCVVLMAALHFPSEGRAVRAIHAADQPDGPL
ncbi:MAG: hypothetical protein KJZ68_08790 [Phycisphaerales bacterium]|nr:hypothetical protein [Phycisphaerales bacterium]